MNQNGLPRSLRGPFLRLYSPEQPAIKMNGKHTTFSTGRVHVQTHATAIKSDMAVDLSTDKMTLVRVFASHLPRAKRSGCEAVDQSG
jgi:hypothetical protein